MSDEVSDKFWNECSISMGDACSKNEYQKLGRPHLDQNYVHDEF